MIFLVTVRNISLEIPIFKKIRRINRRFKGVKKTI